MHQSIRRIAIGHRSSESYDYPLNDLISLSRYRAGNHYYYEHQRWGDDTTREEIKRQTEARKAAIKLRARAPYQETMKGPEWPQSFSSFSSLPVELQHHIIQLAAKDAIAEIFTKVVSYDETIIRRSGECDVAGTERVDMTRNKLVLCLGSLLATNVAVRSEAIRWLEARRVGGCAWEREVRSGKGQAKGDWMWKQLRQTGVVRWEQRGEGEEERCGKREDVRRWGGSVYKFGRVLHVETLNVEIVDWRGESYDVSGCLRSISQHKQG